jgi:hypothetical protein
VLFQALKAQLEQAQADLAAVSAQKDKVLRRCALRCAPELVLLLAL